MNASLLYALAGVSLFVIGLYALIAHAHLLRKILAFNVMGSGVFLVLIATASSMSGDAPDPVPHAMVLTGIVVAVSATALALVLAYRIQSATGSLHLREAAPEER